MTKNPVLHTVVGNIKLPEGMVKRFKYMIEEPVADHLLEGTIGNDGVKVTDEDIKRHYRNVNHERELDNILIDLMDEFNEPFDSVYVDMLDTWFRTKYFTS